VGGVENALGGAVILLELDDGGVGVIFLEVEDVLEVGAAPAVNGLPVVAHHADVLGGRGQEFGDLVLGMVGVLVFVDHDVLELLLVFGE
jgi:hypothetical protein